MTDVMAVSLSHPLILYTPISLFVDNDRLSEL